MKFTILLLLLLLLLLLQFFCSVVISIVVEIGIVINIVNKDASRLSHITAPASDTSLSILRGKFDI